MLSGREAVEVSWEKGHRPNVVGAGDTTGEALQAYGKAAMGRHPVSEGAQVPHVLPGVLPSFAEGAEVVTVAVQALPTRHQLQAVEQQVETAGAFGVVRIGVGVERAFDGRVSRDIQEPGAVRWAQPDSHRSCAGARSGSPRGSSSVWAASSFCAATKSISGIFSGTSGRVIRSRSRASGTSWAMVSSVPARVRVGMAITS